MHCYIATNVAIITAKQKDLTEMLILHASFFYIKGYQSSYISGRMLEKNENGVFNKLDQTSGPADAPPCPQQALEIDASE